MMSIALFSIASFLIFSATLVTLFWRWPKIKLRSSEVVPLLVTIAALVFLAASNLLQHTEITEIFDSSEDIAKILALPFFLFFLNNWYMLRSLERHKEQEEWLRTTFASIPDGVIAVDQQGRVLFLNRAMEILLGGEQCQTNKTPVASLLRLRDAQTDRKMESSLFEEVLSGEATAISREGLEIIAAEERMIPVSIKISKISGTSGKVLGAVGLFRDMGEYHAMQMQLLHERKMEALGQLTGGVAHDLNNMLAGVLGAAELLTEGNDKGGGGETRQLLQLIVKAVGRASELVRGLLDFSRKGKILSMPVNLQEIITSTVAIVERTIDKNIAIVCRLPEEQLRVVGDPAQLQNCFLNLMINARDAMPDGGSIEIVAERELLDDAWCRQSGFDICGGHYVGVRVSDYGRGIPKELHHKIFEPFYTTKEKGKGTGLGLAAVHGIVCSHHGAISLQSEVNRGTTFTVHLPLTDKEIISMAIAEPSKINRPTGSILIIEDEAVVRVTTEMMLEAEGYRVLSASSGDAGLALFASLSSEISVVLLDMVLPKMGGGEIFARLKKLDPGVKVVITSGFSDSAKIEGTVGFLKKPYRKDDLLNAIALAARCCVAG
jgi:PAS domain S-box-containing protein